ncbi:bifunctional D-glycero-beta-D-manno-heptose-7-phosphate kinase/D-glycero-beta-D-manno-heptose 1-phosphate adenylyltransferase HldE [Salinisphaera sp. Q1T1-3]|uniref:bifunctional D-glycero-beta-D-manno-heptose-7-phosphate kinase/D-glycero-beta-D-manno-heptose 1-phosphate adenylyltransferase HldE n=1 Tax=Salinisphaera sp. Q1T1-3 TaxID=2321229 RepID=UPI000E72B00F|nr:bifunctional D-glycero-beta-D-manno-heptose-7-phosphate kinase/D-glycero-beta-D-manno-heptose 1-phosphate adenylyltransferase HldE [Salinisphaera sp. Q1T1-3]RJS94705.1 bifunctional D-glycero-beta-D-manno-heptose-7-phosphate kinase/D-glycero-beta-D-manno-heptose 1-phosphate adenylyltransferase HldE [Salinisphaera sp. Q1T1-3]
MVSIPAFADSRVLVIGDVMLDRYWYGDTGRISPEAPVPVVRIGEEERRLGGAANVAINLAGVGATTRLIGVIGTDEPGRATRFLLDEAGVTADLVESPSHPTIAKLRVMSRNQQLIRLDFEKSFALAGAFDQDALRARLSAALAETDVVVCSDYGKGTLADVEAIIALAREAGVPVLVDPKGRDWQRYTGATLITPNVAEFAAYADDGTAGIDWQDDETLAAHAQSARARLSLDALLVTRSEKGMSLFLQDGTHHLPARAREVFDVTGAGDTVIAMIAAGLGAGQTLTGAAELANLAAGIVVAKLGTATVTREELQHAARLGRVAADGVIDEEGLAEWFASAHARGERIVMTNGCFDLLHPGHIAYLEAARALGDHLVVAVNDDASVGRLKGPQRPINDLTHRMQVLRGLAAVDWVVPFAEDTPERLICRLCPDVLVKGGDYEIADIAGSDCVLAAGGEVRTLTFLDGFSTSAIAARIRDRDATEN